MHRGDLTNFLSPELLEDPGELADSAPPSSAPADSPSLLPSAWVDGTGIGAALTPEIRKQMSSMLQAIGPEDSRSRLEPRDVLGAAQLPPPGAPVLTGLPAHLSSLSSLLIQLKNAIVEELEGRQECLLKPNPSRRDAIAQYLARLAGSSPVATQRPGEALQEWIEGPRSPAQSQALRAYFEELALMVLAQAILLKAWSDRGIRTWSENDLGRLNWALSSALKPHLPLDREGWQITRPNLYSWYTDLSASLQREIWTLLRGWKITDEGPEFLVSLVASARQCKAPRPEPGGYDPRFYSALWSSLASFGFDDSPAGGPLRRRRMVFSPTLRDGSMVRTGPVALGWVGLESSPYLLLLAELALLWWGPSAPPLWANGTGLEAHTRDQLEMGLGSPKPSLLSRISEMEACDLALVVEERCLRSNGRTGDAQRLREQLEALPYFKRIRAPGTTLGDLQACVALSKLRPGGLLVWAREEPLGSQDGAEVLGFLLDRARIVCEWNLSGVQHPLRGPELPSFPKHLYLLAREQKMETRVANRPLRVLVEGQLRSHVETAVLIEDALRAPSCPDASPRGGWRIHVQQSPTPQREWADRWPDPACHDRVRDLEKLRLSSLPLGSVATIRPTPEPRAGGGWSVHPSLRGLWISEGPDRSLVPSRLPAPGHEAQAVKEAKGSGFLVLVADETWISPIIEYLATDAVREWLDHHAERRGDRWVLSEQIVKWIPVPRTLLDALGFQASEEAAQASGAGALARLSRRESSFALPLPGDWERLVSLVEREPAAVLRAMERLGRDDEGMSIRAAVFVRTARSLERLQAEHARLLSIVDPSGKILWRELLEALPARECVAVSLHPQLRVVGNLPPQAPIDRIERVRSAGSQGILLLAENGMHLHVSSDSGLLMEMLSQQLEGIVHPTWGELLRYLRLPRRLELAELMASDVLRSHGEQSARMRELRDLLSACALV